MRLMEENLSNTWSEYPELDAEIKEDKPKTKTKNKSKRSKKETIIFDASHWIMRLLAERTLERLKNRDDSIKFKIKNDEIKFKGRGEARTFRAEFMIAFREKRAKWKMPPEWPASLIHMVKKDACLKELGLKSPKPGMTEEEVLNIVFNNRLKITVLPLLTWLEYLAESNNISVDEVIDRLESDKPEVYLPLLVKVGVVSKKEYEAWIRYEGKEGGSDYAEKTVQE